ncbi:hypothetical protein NHH03_07230 [Stieleria sp. TO1_6]|uniref:hypothetical protein n=1 Tax=Stieleria tagensis TaxID=2956795 RepID=UPI00209A9801|nr:hypothetical protein [Stieleria tagensis]MCO8121522.1 hypothetical protein [Stieleria tagensis]
MNGKLIHVLTSTATLLAIIAAVSSKAHSQSPDGKSDREPSFTQGEVRTGITKLYQWTGNNPRTANVGSIQAADGTKWTVPAKTHFQSATKAADLYNEANGVKPGGIGDVDLEAIPVIDAGGDELFTAYVFGDNYFEFYVNGKLLAVDPVPMTPFNSTVIRFKSQRPFTVGIMGVDWEERLGLGFEQFRGAPFHQGDAGLVAVIKDAADETVAITDRSWKAQTFYIAPLKTKECLVVSGAIRDSSKCSTEDTADGTAYFAAHWPIPANWAATDFDDSDWPNAVTFTNDYVGVDNKPAYTNFTDLFDAPDSDAQFIWSSSLVHDNLVLMRTTVDISR